MVGSSDHQIALMSRHFDTIVIGVGGMGSAACYHLARRGVRVLGIEQFDLPHDRGSSHGFSRMIRTAYYEHPSYVPLLQRAWGLWKQLEEESLSKLLHVTGGLYLGTRECELIAGSLTACRQHVLAHELHDHRELAGLFPQFRVPETFVGLYEYQAGFLLPELCIAAHVDLAMRHGAEIHGNEAVVKWKTNDRGATVTTTRDTYTADEIVFCGGAWTSKLVRDLGIELLVTRQALGWVQPLRRDRFQLGAFPVWAIGHEDASLHYGFPMHAEAPGLKVARHAPGMPVDPDAIERRPHREDEASFRPILREYLPEADGPTLSVRICMYTNSPDHHFIIDRHPQHSRVTFACGFSGHGFKFASVVGEVVADLAMKGRTTLPVEFLGISRFSAVESGPSDPA